MKTFTFLSLMSASLALALPMRIGNTWTWSVRDIGADTTSRNWLTATVVRSSSHDSGTAWTLQVRDSASRTSDTAVALERPDHSQAWLIGSRNLKVELQPWDGKNQDNSGHTNMATAPWGYQSLRPNGWRIESPYFTVAKSPGGTSNGGLNEMVGGRGEYFPVPRGIWNDSVGLLIFRNYAYGPKETRLTTFNRLAVDVSPYRAQAHLPAQGTTLEWEEWTRHGCARYGFLCQDSGAPVHHTWTILDASLQNSGRVFVRFRDSSIDDSGHVSDSLGTLETSLDSWSSDVPRGRCPLPLDAWFSDWSDSATSVGIERSAVTGTASVSTGIYYDLHIVSEAIRADHQVDSIVCTKQSYQSRVWQDITTRKLVAVNGKQVATPRITRTSRGKPRETPRTLSDLRPDQVVRWSDAQGRGGTLRAGDATSPSKFGVRGLLFLTAALPDGSFWRGSLILP